MPVWVSLVEGREEPIKGFRLEQEVKKIAIAVRAVGRTHQVHLVGAARQHDEIS